MQAQRRYCVCRWLVPGGNTATVPPETGNVYKRVAVRVASPEGSHRSHTCDTLATGVRIHHASFLCVRIGTAAANVKCQTMGSGARDKIVSVELNAHEVALQPNGRSRGSCACSPLICILSVSLLFVTVGLLVATVFHNHDKQLKNRMKLQLERRNTTCSSSQCLRVS